MRLLPALLVPLLLAAALRAGDAPRPTNIVFFLADDLGQRDLGSYGSTFYETPHLDRLAREGARFTDAGAITAPPDAVAPSCGACVCWCSMWTGCSPMAASGPRSRAR